MNKLEDVKDKVLDRIEDAVDAAENAKWRVKALVKEKIVQIVGFAAILLFVLAFISVVT